MTFELRPFNPEREYETPGFGGTTLIVDKDDKHDWRFATPDDALLGTLARISSAARTARDLKRQARRAIDDAKADREAGDRRAAASALANALRLTHHACIIASGARATRATAAAMARQYLAEFDQKS